MKTNHDERYVLLSIQPAFATQIFDGTKTVELRRSFPKLYQTGSVIIYVSTPVKAIMGGFHISRVLKAEPDQIWKAAGKYAGVTQQKFDEYYDGAEHGYAIFIDDVWLYKSPIPLETLRKQIDNFLPPQNFRYISKTRADSLRCY
ncbi:MAG TPA: ASCH domain-containing protein [Pyrinomonadaceae bacterium]|nr:ASCH domain-containing protein [Pyrinomonadaceae bacterium]